MMPRYKSIFLSKKGEQAFYAKHQKLINTVVAKALAWHRYRVDALGSSSVTMLTYGCSKPAQALIEATATLEAFETGRAK